MSTFRMLPGSRAEKKRSERLAKRISERSHEQPFLPVERAQEARVADLAEQLNARQFLIEQLRTKNEELKNAYHLARLDEVEMRKTIAELVTDRDILKEQNAILWTQLLKLRNAIAEAPLTTEVARRYFED